MHRDVTAFILLSVSKGGKVLLGSLITIVIARNMGAEALGKWAMLIACGTLMHSVFLNWLQVSLVRFGREEFLKENRISRSYSARVPWVLIGFMIPLCILLLDPGEMFYTFFGLDEMWLVLSLAYMCFLWLMAETQSLMQIRTAFSALSFCSVAVEAIALTALVVLTCCSFSKGVDFTVLMLVGIYLFSWLCIYLFQVQKLGVSLQAPDVIDVKKIAIYGWPLIPGFFAGYASDWGDHLLLQYYYSSDQVGYLQPAYQFMLILMGVVAPIGTILFPRLIGDDSMNARMPRFAERYISTVASIWGVMIVPVIVLAPSCIQFAFGEKFELSVSLFSILCIAVPGAIFSVLYGVLFNIQARNGRAMLYVCIMAIINILLSLLLIPSMGAVGAVVGTSVSYIVVQTAYLVDQNKFLNIECRHTVLLFVCLVIFGVGQSILLDFGSWRWLFSGIMLIVIVTAIRYYALVNESVLDSVFQKKFFFVRTLIQRLLVSH